MNFSIFSDVGSTPAFISTPEEDDNTTAPSLDITDPFWNRSLLLPLPNIIDPDLSSHPHLSQKSKDTAPAISSTPVGKHFNDDQVGEKEFIDDILNIDKTSPSVENRQQETAFRTTNLNDFSLSNYTGCDQHHLTTPSSQIGSNGQQNQASIDPSHANNECSPIFEHAHASCSQSANRSSMSPTSIVATTLAAAALKPSIVPIPITRVLHNHSAAKSKSTATKNVKATKKVSKHSRKMSKREAAKAATAAALSEELKLAHLAKTNQITDEELLLLKPKKKRRAAKFEKAIPSRFCHICSRTPKRVRLAVCSKIKSGTCRKVICEKCFVKYGYGDFEDAQKTNETEWLCPHCSGACPARAQCRTYQRINDRLRVSRLKQECPKRRLSKPSRCPSASKLEVTTPSDEENGNNFSERQSPEPNMEDDSYETMLLEEDDHVQGERSPDNMELEESMSDVPFQPPTQLQDMEAKEAINNLLSLEELIPPLQTTNVAISPTLEADDACFQKASEDNELFPQRCGTPKQNSITHSICEPIVNVQAVAEVMPANGHAIGSIDGQLWHSLNLSSVDNSSGGIGGPTLADTNDGITSSFTNYGDLGTSNISSQIFNFENTESVSKLEDAGQTVSNIDTYGGGENQDYGNFLEDSEVEKGNNIMANDLVLNSDENKISVDEHVREEEGYLDLIGTS